jgi:SAM-dependent methyltransferase
MNAASVIHTATSVSDRRILQLGSGKKYHASAVNIDVARDTHPDVVHDLNSIPWPFRADTFFEVWAYDVIEHLDDVVRVMEEIHRVSVPGALVKLTVPHFSSRNAFTDPTHRHFFSVGSFDYFTAGSELNFYTAARFEKSVASIVFAPTPMNKLVHRLARRFPEQYERRWAWIFPAWFIYMELSVVKLGA